jgi:hypothetical protein
LFITSRIFSGILAIGSGMQHHQKTMYNPSFKTLVLHHSELIATTSKEFVFAESVNPFIMLNGEEITTTYQ